MILHKAAENAPTDLKKELSNNVWKVCLEFTARTRLKGAVLLGNNNSLNFHELRASAWFMLNRDLLR